MVYFYSLLLLLLFKIVIITKSLACYLVHFTNWHNFFYGGITKTLSFKFKLPEVIRRALYKYTHSSFTASNIYVTARITTTLNL